MPSAQDLLNSLRPELAWEPFTPTRKSRWDVAKAAHLYRRAAFGAPWDVIEAAAASNPLEVVQRLVRGLDGLQRFENDVERLTPGTLASNDRRELQGLWMYRLLNSPHPLQEKLTLFWHNHFATSHAKVTSGRLMHRQNETLRRYSLGSFAGLLREMTFDPAMLIWLDSNTNRKGAPNENYAREVFELFSLSPGHYTEQDIKEAARAFTGWSTKDEQPFFNPAEYDASAKTIFGQTGAFAAGDVVRLALGQPACARFIVRKLFREFINDSATPPDSLIEPLAAEYRLRDYDTGWLVQRMLSSWLFYSDAAIQQRIKSPVEYVVGTVRSLGGTVSPLQAADICGQLGQSLYFPPNVKGWDGGREWISSTTLLLRQNVAFEITKGRDESARLDPARWAVKYEARTPEQIADLFLNMFVQRTNSPAREQIVAQLRTEMESANDRPFARRENQARLARLAAHLVLALPESQLS